MWVESVHWHFDSLDFSICGKDLLDVILWKICSKPISVKMRNSLFIILTLTTMKRVFTGPQLHHRQLTKQQHHLYFHKSILTQDLTSAVVVISVTCFWGCGIILNHIQSNKCLAQLKSYIIPKLTLVTFLVSRPKWTLVGLGLGLLFLRSLSSPLFCVLDLWNNK